MLKHGLRNHLCGTANTIFFEKKLHEERRTPRVGGSWVERGWRAKHFGNSCLAPALGHRTWSHNWAHDCPHTSCCARVKLCLCCNHSVTEAWADIPEPRPHALQLQLALQVIIQGSEGGGPCTAHAARALLLQSLS